MFDAIVAGSHLRFDGVWQRPHQILSRLASRAAVLWVEEPLRAEVDEDSIVAHGAVDVLRPLRRSATHDADPSTCRSAVAWCAGRRPLVWLHTPMMLALADAFADAPVVFDRMDDLAAFDFAPPKMREREAALLRRASLIFAGGRSLFEGCRPQRPDARLYPSGVEFERFARTVPPHPLFEGLVRPVFGYIGVVDERIDVAILRELCARDCSVVIVGPVAKIDPAILPRPDNAHFTGQVAYADLPSYLAGFDVAIMPFARNAATAAISPTKTLEYLAAGKPVVSTAIADVVAAFGNVVQFAASPAEFADLCERAARVHDSARVARGIELARAASWDSIVDRMWSEVSRLAPGPF